MSLPWKSGQECLVVQCDRVTGEPVPDGLMVAAVTVQFHMNADIEVTLTGPHDVWVAERFDAAGAWNTYGRERTWRLMMPGDFTAEEPAPGGPVPDPPGHGYQKKGGY